MQFYFFYRKPLTRGLIAFMMKSKLGRVVWKFLFLHRSSEKTMEYDQHIVQHLSEENACHFKPSECE